MSTPVPMSSKTSVQEAQEKHDLKKKALAFYTENGVPERMEDILNSMFYDNPSDVYGHLANYFETFKKTPTISKLVSREGLDGKGQATVQAEVYCMVKNHEKLVVTSTSSNESYPPDSMKPEEKEAAEAERLADIQTSIEMINSTLSEVLKEQDPTKQQEIDDLLTNKLHEMAEAEAEKRAKEAEEAGQDGEMTARSPAPQESKMAKPKSPKGKGKAPPIIVVPDEPREQFIPGSTAVGALSQAVCCTGAVLADTPLYKHITACRTAEDPQEYSLPVPMVTILMSGKLSPGKLQCVKEFMVMPRPDMPYSQSVKHIVNIYNHCAKTLSAKTGIVGRAVGDLGALWTTFDRVEQGLDLLQEAITQQELTPGTDFHIALNCAAHEHFDYDKGKYEVMVGQQKLAEDLVDFWAELLTRYPTVIALIDPMRKQEKEAWMRLCETISEKCYILGDQVCHRAGLLKDEEATADFRTSGVILRMEHINTVSDIIGVTNKMQEAGNEVVIGNSVGETNETFNVDLAIGCGAKFIKLAAPCRGERIAKFNRLLQVEASLESTGNLKVNSEHSFCIIKPPIPTPEPTEGDGELNISSRSTDSKKS